MIDRAADISEDGRYRYTLLRRWSATNTSIVTFLMLNPSTADADKDDPTIRRCTGFAKDWGYGGLHVINLYAYRTAYPVALWMAKKDRIDIVGPKNNLKIVQHAKMAHEQGWPLVAAWGASAKDPERIQTVLGLPYVARTLQCLGVSKTGQPRHPLMLAKTTALEPWPKPDVDPVDPLP